MRYILVSTLLIASLPANAQENKEFADERVAKILSQHCYQCHGKNGSAEGGFNFLFDRDRLVFRRLVSPSEANKSPLFQRIEKGEMPPKGHDALKQDEIKILHDWIMKDAPAFPHPFAKKSENSQRPPSSTLGRTGILFRIESDLFKIPEGDQRFMRYFTLANIRNAGATEEELDTYRLALAKLINSLSWNDRIVLPTAIEATNTIYRIDLRDYKWSTKTWEAIAQRHPYGLTDNTKFEQHCREKTGTTKFLLRGDWFAAYATSPAEYYRLLGLAENAEDVEQFFGVAAVKSLQAGRSKRAGFGDSKVASGGRIVERHQSNFGSFWMTHNFRDPQGHEAHPLINAAALPLHDSHEIIFQLPNGLHGFFVWDRNLRLADSSSLRDPRQPGMQVRAGLSCMTCHSKGLIPCKDEFLAIAGKNPAKFTADTLATVQGVFMPADELKRAFDTDNKRYQEALTALGIGLSEADPVTALALRYNEGLTLRQIAADVGFDEVRLRIAFKKLDRYASFLKARPNRELLTRPAFESMLPELVRDLKLGALQDRTVPSAPILYRAMMRPLHPTATTTVATRVTPRDPPSKDPLAFPPSKIPNPVPNPDNFLPPIVPADDHEDKLIGMETIHKGDRVVVRFPEVSSRNPAVAIAPKGTLIAAQREEGVILLFDPYSSRKPLRLEAHQDEITDLVFSADGAFLYSSSLDGTMKKWRTSSGLLLLICKEGAPVRRMTAGLGGQRIICVADNLSGWDARYGTKVLTAGPRTPEPPPRFPVRSTPRSRNYRPEMTDIAISPDGSLIASTVGNGLRLLLPSLKDKMVLDSGRLPQSKVAFSNDGKLLAAGIGSSIHLYELPEGKLLHTFRGQGSSRDMISGLAFTADDKFLIRAAPGSDLTVFEVAFKAEYKSVPDSKLAGQLSANSAGDYFVTRNSAGIQLWKQNLTPMPPLPAPTNLGPFEGHTTFITDMALSFDGKRLVTGSDDFTVRIWDAATGKQTHVLKEHTKRIRSVAISEDGNTAFSAAGDGYFCKWDLKEGKLLEKWELPKSPWRVRFRPNGQSLFVADGKQDVLLLSTKTGRIARTLDQKRRVNGDAFSGNSRFLVTADAGSGTHIWDFETGKKRSFDPIDGNVTLSSVAISRDGRYFVAYIPTVDGTLAAWDVATGKQLCKLGPFRCKITDILFNNDSSSFLISTATKFGSLPSPAYDVPQSVIQIDTNTGQMIQYWPLNTTATSLTSSFDGAHVYYASRNKIGRFSPRNGKSIAGN